MLDTRFVGVDDVGWLFLDDKDCSRFVDDDVDSIFLDDKNCSGFIGDDVDSIFLDDEDCSRFVGDGVGSLFVGKDNVGWGGFVISFIFLHALPALKPREWR